MTRGSKDSYTDKQKRKAKHIVEGYEDRGIAHDEAERRAWATVNKDSGGGNKSGSGCGVADSNESAKKGGHSMTAQQHSAAAKKGWQTRRRMAAH
jgi:plasmid stabilization system protein ParE